LLLGQSALKKLGTVLIDYDENTLTIIPKKSQAILVDTSSINNEISQKDLADSSSNLTEDEQFFRLGKEGFMNSDYTSAIYYFDRAIQINGNKSDYYFYRALSKDGSDELKDALIDYNTYLSMDKKSSKGYGYRAELLIRLGDTLGAIKDFQYAIQLDSKNIYAYRELAKVYIAKKSYALAIKYLNTATKFDSTDYSTFQIRGVAKFRNKNYLGARLDFDTAIILNPENSYSFTLRGAAKTELKQFESARNDLNKALEIDSSSAVTFRYLAQISEHYKELEQAVVYYKKALEIDSTDLHSTLKVYLLEQEIKSQIWISIFKSDDQEIFIKNEIESNKYGVISIWIKANKKKYTRVVNGKNVVYLNSYSTEFLQIDCVSKRMKIDYTAIYDSAGKTISSEQLDYSDWTVVPPETIGELIIKEVCKRYN
jgi:tetratricopeptide (TPR) repeat protein